MPLKGQPWPGKLHVRFSQPSANRSRVLGLSTEEYGRALTAIGQIALKGRVQQEELLQLAEAGIPIYGALAQSLGKTTGELAKMLEQGQVSDAIAVQPSASCASKRKAWQRQVRLCRADSVRAMQLPSSGAVGTTHYRKPQRHEGVGGTDQLIRGFQQMDLRKELGLDRGNDEGSLPMIPTETSMPSGALSRCGIAKDRR